MFFNKFRNNHFVFFRICSIASSMPCLRNYVQLSFTFATIVNFIRHRYWCIHICTCGNTFHHRIHCKVLFRARMLSTGKQNECRVVLLQLWHHSVLLHKELTVIVAEKRYEYVQYSFLYSILTFLSLMLHLFPYG